jgi:hypothetical protein
MRNSPTLYSSIVQSPDRDSNTYERTVSKHASANPGETLDGDWLTVPSAAPSNGDSNIVTRQISHLHYVFGSSLCTQI